MTTSVPLSPEQQRLAILQDTRLLDGSEAPAAFQALARLATRTLSCQAAVICVLDNSSAHVIASQGWTQRIVALGEAPFDASAVTGLPSAVDAIASPPLWQLGAATSDTPTLLSYARAPLFVEGVCVGCAIALHSETRNWSSSDLLALDDIALSAQTLIEAELHRQRARKMAARVRTASHAGSDWLWETDSEGHLTWISDSFQQHTGLDPELELGTPAGAVYDHRSDETRASWEQLRQAVHHRAPFLDAIGERETPHGRLIVSASGSPVFNSKGDFMGYRGACRNVTKQVLAEQHARRADLLLRQAMEAFDFSVMIADENRNVVLANDRWKAWAGSAWDAEHPNWERMLRRLVHDGAYPDAVGREEAFVQWRMSLVGQGVATEVRFRNRWMLLQDQRLADGNTVHCVMDITERKEATLQLAAQEKALRDKDAHLRAVLSALPDLWFVIDRHGCYGDGHEGHPMLVRPMEELRGRPVGIHLPYEVAALQGGAIKRLREMNTPQELEYQLETRDGVLRHFEARMTPMPHGEILFLTRDITDKKESEDKLRVSEELYRSVASTISDGLLIVDLLGHILALNPVASRMLGVRVPSSPNEHPLQLSELRLLAPDLATPLPIEQWPVYEAIHTGERVVDRILPMRRGDGQVIWIQMSSNVLRVGPDEPPFAAMASFRDITLEHRALQELAVSEERWKFALEGAGDGVWDWNISSGEVFYSPRWKAMLGYQDHDVQPLAEEYLSRVHPDDQERVRDSFIRYAAEGHGIHQMEFRIAHRDGHYLHALSRGKVVSRDAYGAPQRMVGTLSDISPIKHAEHSLREKHAAEAASTAKSEFLSRMSHEMRTPLNAVSGFAQLLRLQMAKQGVPREQTNYVRQILHAARHLTCLVNDVLDLQQVETGMLTFHPEDLCLREVVLRCISMLNPLADQREVQLVPDLDWRWYVQADRQRLSQVIMNLASNAIKYNRAGGQVTFRACTLMDDSRLILQIQDTGTGMSEAQLSKLFQPFERLGKETSSIEGTGLGLIITRSLVEAMGGQLDIQSQLGAGTCVNINLPLVIQPSLLSDSDTDYATAPADSLFAPLMSDSLSPTDSAAVKAPLRVLYVEDNRINAMLFEEALRPHEQLQLEIAEDGDSAIALSSKWLPEVLVLDAHLPGMTGFEVLASLRKIPGLEDVPAYMCSADAMPEDIAKAKEAGFTGYWTKPIDIMTVTNELCRLADKGDSPTIT